MEFVSEFVSEFEAGHGHKIFWEFGHVHGFGLGHDFGHDWTVRVAPNEKETIVNYKKLRKIKFV